MEINQYDVVIIGGGASGTALLYVLSKYTNLNRIALVEKNTELGAVNSNAKNNSQTLHVGDIETHYPIEKVKQVKPAAELVLSYVRNLPVEEQNKILKIIPKMVLAVGADEVTSLEARYTWLKEIFPNIEKIGPDRLAELEPEVMRGRAATEPVLALYNPEGYAVNFGALAKSLATKAKTEAKTIDILTSEKILHLEKNSFGYRVKTNLRELKARVVVVDADAHSLHFSKSLGYGQEYSLIPIAGTFYFSDERLRGKVYTVQEPRFPFASVHGDPDLTRVKATRWGPTARLWPVLESRNFRSFPVYLRSSGLHRLRTWVSFASILLEPIRFKYLVRNTLYELPIFGKRLFLNQIKKIVPSLRARDLYRAKGYGGMRLQRVDTNTRELLLGEGKIIGEHIIFNMTPSPGASVCLYNATRDTEKIMEFFEIEFAFDKTKFTLDHSPLPTGKTATSLTDSYAS